jgi:hypothetical protein
MKLQFTSGLLGAGNGDLLHMLEYFVNDARYATYETKVTCVVRRGSADITGLYGFKLNSHKVTRGRNNVH